MMSPFDFPIDEQFLLRKKRSLRRELLASNQTFLEKKIAILGGSTTAEAKDQLEIFLLSKGIKPQFYESEYNKYMEDLCFPNEALDGFKPDLIYIHTSFRNIGQFPSLNSSKEEFENILNAEFSRLKNIWSAASQKYNCPIIQNNFDLPAERLLGNLDCSHQGGKVYFINSLNLKMSEYAQEHNAFYIQDINYLSSQIGLGTWHNPSEWYSYKYAISLAATPHLAKSLSNIIGSIYGRAKKALILDLDNTCWGGVIGDDGANNISIGLETAVGEAHTALQSYAKALKQRGVVLAVCSKNEDEIARQGFKHPYSVLELDDFSAFKANWNRKDQNVVEISQELNLGIDSFVFIDDNPTERQIVRETLPSVGVPEVGSDIANYVQILDRNGYFEAISLSNDDMQRSQFYADNSKRTEAQASFQDYSSFLESLEMVASIGSFSDVYMERIAQLINKTNQFNLTTRRYTLEEVKSISQSPNHIHLYGRLADKFGDNGLVSVVLGTISESVLEIDLWLMSCRVLKRDMENAMFDSLIEQARSKGVSRITSRYLPTPKNMMVKDFYSSLGFKTLSKSEVETKYEYIVQDHQISNQFIKVHNE